MQPQLRIPEPAATKWTALLSHPFSIGLNCFLLYAVLWRTCERIKSRLQVCLLLSLSQLVLFCCFLVSIKCSVSVLINRKEALDAAVISRLVQIAKTASPNLLRKAISVIEFGTVIDPTMDTIISEDITAVLDVALHQNVLDGTSF